MGSERGDEYKRLRPVGEGTGSKESEYSEAPQRATASRLVPTHQQDHRAIKRRCASMTGFKSFRSAATTLTGIELAHRIRKRQFSLGRGRYQNFGSLKRIWAERSRSFFPTSESQMYRSGSESPRDPFAGPPNALVPLAANQFERVQVGGA
jgi:hypothetical protein